MKKGKMALALCLCTLCISQAGVLTVSAGVAEVPPSVSATAIEPRADKIEWRYKIVDGKMYKRQYNVTKKQWIGEWELMK